MTDLLGKDPQELVDEIVGETVLPLPVELISVSVEEAVRIGAVDTLFYGRYFFPRTFRQKSPSFHRRICNIIERQGNRYVTVAVFRGGAKTTLLRVITSKRIAYGAARTILYISKSEDHAVKSVKWIKRRVEEQGTWARAFGLVPGPKWSETEIEIKNVITGETVTLIALGITGQTRGINVEDYRPDLIIVDDANDEENTATVDQREKISDLFFGAIAKSLASEVDAPLAQLILLQTPLDREDLVAQTIKDPRFVSEVCGCFDESGKSVWEDLYPTPSLVAEKDGYIGRNKLSIWLREMECKLVSPESSAFKAEWLQKWDLLPEGGVDYIGVDPTPPAREGAIVRLSHLDDAAIVVIRRYPTGAIYLRDYYVTKSPNPEEFAVKFMEMVMTFRPLLTGIETILFARVLKSFIDLKMRERAFFFPLISVEDKRKKDVRIRQAITGPASHRMLYVHASHTQFIEQFSSYPDTRHDDLLDALSIAIMLSENLVNVNDEAIEGQFRILESKIPALPRLRGSP